MVPATPVSFHQAYPRQSSFQPSSRPPSDCCRRTFERRSSRCKGLAPVQMRVLWVSCAVRSVCRWAQRLCECFSELVSRGEHQSTSDSDHSALLTAKPTLHLLSPLSPSPLRTIKVRAQKPTCPACGTFPSADPSTLSTASSRWAAFLAHPEGHWEGWEDPLCDMPGVGCSSLRREGTRRIRAGELAAVLESGARILDVRSKAEFGICHLDGSISGLLLLSLNTPPKPSLTSPSAFADVPFPLLLKDPSSALDLVFSSPTSSSTTSTLSSPIYLVCRRGNDSLLAARALSRHLATQAQAPQVKLVDVMGGLTAWSRDVDANFPLY